MATTDWSCFSLAKGLTTPYCFPWDQTLISIYICDYCRVEAGPLGYEEQ